MFGHTSLAKLLDTLSFIIPKSVISYMYTLTNGFYYKTGVKCYSGECIKSFSALCDKLDELWVKAILLSKCFLNHFNSLIVLNDSNPLYCSL